MERVGVFIRMTEYEVQRMERVGVVFIRARVGMTCFVLFGWLVHM